LQIVFNGGDQLTGGWPRVCGFGSPIEGTVAVDGVYDPQQIASRGSRRFHGFDNVVRGAETESGERLDDRPDRVDESDSFAVGRVR
jgi:hypothetical protein